jgi:hypothetical protein
VSSGKFFLADPLMLRYRNRCAVTWIAFALFYPDQLAAILYICVQFQPYGKQTISYNTRTRRRAFWNPFIPTTSHVLCVPRLRDARLSFVGRLSPSTWYPLSPSSRIQIRYVRTSPMLAIWKSMPTRDEKIAKKAVWRAGTQGAFSTS